MVEKKIKGKFSKKENKEERKRPGRPRKIPLKKPCPRNGIVNTPRNEQNYMEFVYDNPCNFKKIWQYFKLMAVSKIQMIFRPKEVILWSQDHHKKSEIKITIDADKVNHYYCIEELDIGILCENPELIMATINGEYQRMLFLSQKNYVQKNIHIIFKNNIEIDETHKIELIGEYNKMENEDIFEDNDYTIQFELPGKYFKKMIADIRAFSDQITIRQDSMNDPLVFEYAKDDKKVKSHYIVRNDDQIKFHSKLKEDESFRVSFKIEYVRPISSAMLADKILIKAHENKPLMFYVSMDDGTIKMQTMTEIINLRNLE